MEPFDAPGEASFRAEARRWLADHAEPLSHPAIAPSAIVAEWRDEEEEAKLADARRWQRTKYDAGWAGIAWPVEVGGRDGTPIEAVIFAEEELKFDVPRDALAVGLGWCGPAILQHGSAAARDRFLRPLLRGDEVWCQLFSEPSAGSDLAGLLCRAVRDGDEWLLTGQKTWTTFAHRSDWGLCVARHDPEVPKHRGLTAFIVDMGAPGVECRPVRQMTGSANFNEVFLDDVRVPDAHRIGEVGEGWRVVVTTFMHERIGLTVDAAGVVEALRALIVALGLQHDGRVRERFAALYSRAQVLGYQRLRLLTGLARGNPPGPEGSVMKLAATALLTDIYGLAIDLMGPRGILFGGEARDEWHAAFLGVPGLRIGGGTDQIQRNIIGERILGLPSDVRVDKDRSFVSRGS